jgi:two-component system, chemotaxis family, chemotaxis protein CheY
VVDLMDDLLREFLTETSERLDTVDNRLVRFEQDPSDAKILDNIFRLVHPIKGTLRLPRIATAGSKMSFQVIEAEDGVDALVVCKRAMRHAVLLDWNMPVIDGYQFLGHSRRMPGGETPKVAFCTTETGTEQISKAIDGGADEYIMKPFDKCIVAAKFQEVGLIERTEPTSV